MSCIQASQGAAPCARHRAHHQDWPAGFQRALAALGRKLALWFTRYQTRRALRELDAHLLRDIGLTRDEAMREAAKPFWIE